MQYFDKAYCLHLAEDTYRLSYLETEINKLPFPIEIWWTCKREVSKSIDLPSIKTSYYDYIRLQNKNVYASVFNCAFEHYTIIKQAYLRGFNNILVMEDDIFFNDSIKDALKYIPKDYDVIKFWSTGYLDNQNWDGQKNPFVKITNYSNECSTACYALSRRGMKLYLELQDISFKPADMPFFNMVQEGVNYYSLTSNVCKPQNFLSSINYD